MLTRDVRGHLPKLLPILLGVLVFATFRDYGYSWDETWQNRWYGQAVIRFITSLGEDRSATSTNNFYLYGGTFDVAAELLVAATPLEPRNARHLGNALAGLGGIAACWALARRVGGASAGVWAAVLLASCAPWYGHMFINAKDIPFAAGYAWSLLLVMRFLDELPAPRLASALLLGGALGLTLGVRIGGVLVILYLGVFLLAHVLRAVSRPGGGAAWLRLNGLRIVGPLLAAGGVAWALMLACWPAALLRPVSMPLEAIRAAGAFNWVGQLLWNGEVIWSNALPWSYFPVLLAVQLPEVLVVLFGAALAWGVARSLGLSVAGLHAERRDVALLTLGAVFPVVWTVATGATLYDNGRHLLFVLPPMASLAAVGWSRLVELASERRRALALLLPAALLAGLVPAAVRMVALHPYEYAFLNVFAGGMPEGAQRFDTDYWLTSYEEASRSVVAHAVAASAAARIPFQSARFTVGVVGPPEILAESLPRNFEVVGAQTNSGFDYLVVTTRWNSDREWEGWTRIAEVGRAGMRFAMVLASPALARLAPPP